MRKLILLLAFSLAAMAQTNFYGMTITRIAASGGDPTGNLCTNPLEFALYGTKWMACVSGTWQLLGNGSMIYPAAGIAVSTGAAWTTSLTAPAGPLVGTTDTQTLTNKTVDGVSPTTLGYLDVTSSIQTQLNNKQVEFLWYFCAGTTCSNDSVVAPRPLGIARTLLSCTVMAGTAPSSGSVVFDVQLDGTSVYGANPKPTIATSNDCKNNASGCTVSTFSTSALPAGAHYLTASIAGTSGQDVIGLCVAR